MKKKISVLVIDDSALVRNLLSSMINSHEDLEVIGTAPDPLIAREMIRRLNPDVLTLDIEMPKMDGLEFLEKLMRLRPMPVIMISTLTEKSAEATMEALALGAIDFVSKPKVDVASELQSYSEEIAHKIRMAASAQVKRPTAVPTDMNQITSSASGINRIYSTEKLIIVGSSTGGTEALKDFLVNLPPDMPGILIAQHMPETFTKSFANRLNSLCKISVKEAQGGERILPGHVFIAPGHSHLLLKRSGANYVTELSQSEPVNRHRPSVDVLFRSAATYAGKNAIGVILTGMGKDGAAGILEMRKAGAYNFAQDEASCVVFGMPKAAIEIGATDEVVPLKNMASRVLAKLSNFGMDKMSVRI